MKNLGRLRRFIQSFTRLIEQVGNNETQIFSDGKPLLAELIDNDDWLPEIFSESNPERYQQNLLHCDSYERFSLVSFVWGPGQSTPIHDHTVWGMVGVMRGAETCEEFALDSTTGRLGSKGVHELRPGKIDFVSPRVGDIHRVSNALTDRASISIHVYGANIGAIRRHTYARETGEQQLFISGYSKDITPNIWDR